MTPFRLPVLALLLSLAATPALARDLKPSKDYLAFSVGYFNAFDAGDNAVDFRAEIHPAYDLGWGIKPWFGIEMTSEASFWGGFGFERDFFVSDNIFITPSLGAGFYAQGGSDHDLDYPLEFRSQLLVGYETDEANRFGVSLSHLSNASLGDKNPGTEVVNFYYSIPW